MKIGKVDIDRDDGSRAGQTGEHEEGDEILENHIGLSLNQLLSSVLFLRFVDRRACALIDVRLLREDAHHSLNN
jgi:hypothetical protein